MPIFSKSCTFAGPLSFAHDQAVAQRQHPLAFLGQLGVVRDEHDGLVVFFMQLVKEIHHDAARLAVQCAGRLVGQDQRRLIDHGAGNRNALLLSAGKLVGLVAHPLAHADALAQVQWHEEVHRLLAESVLATLSENPGAAPADIVTKATLATPHAARVLTAGSSYPSSTPEAIGAYLAEELALGDAEEAIGALTAQMNAGADAEEAELLHAAVTTLQMDVAARRVAHRALPAS